MAITQLPVISQGVVREKRVSRQAIKKQYTRSLSLAWNCDLREKTGAVMVRKGSVKLGSTNPLTSNTPRGVGVLDSIAYNRPFGAWMVSGSASLRYYDGANWQTATGFPTTDREYDFAQLGGRMFAVGASTMYESDALAVWTNQEARGCLQLEAKVVWVMGARLFVSQITGKPGYVGFSSIWNDAVSSRITWNTDNLAGDFIVVNPDDGAGEVVGGVFAGSTYIIFKERATYMYRRAQQGVEPDMYIPVGSANKDSYTECSGYAYFFSAPIRKSSGVESGGFYMTNGMNKKNVGWPIQDILDAVSDASKVRVESDEHSVYLYLGDIPIDDVVYANVVMIYNVDNDAWEGPHSFPYDNLRFSRGAIHGLIAQTNDKIVQLESDNATDDGVQIDYVARSNDNEITEEAYMKSLREFTVYTQNAQGSTLHFKSKKRGLVGNKNNHTIDGDICIITNPMPGDFNTYTWEWRGTKKEEPAVFEGAIIEYEQKANK